MPRMAGKLALMEMLRAEGVEYIFGNPGTSESPIMSSLEEYPDLKYMLSTQEGVDVPFTGIAISHHPNGRVNQRTQFRSGRKHGRESFWHPNGRLRFQGTYANGILEGPATHWHDNGQKKREVVTTGLHWFWWLVGVGLLASLIWMWAF